MQKQIAIALERLSEQDRRAEALAEEAISQFFLLSRFASRMRERRTRCCARKIKRRIWSKRLLVTEESTEEERVMAGVIGKKGDDLKEARRNLERKLGNVDQAARIAGKQQSSRCC